MVPVRVCACGGPNPSRRSGSGPPNSEREKWNVAPSSQRPCSTPCRRDTLQTHPTFGATESRVCVCVLCAYVCQHRPVAHSRNSSPTGNLPPAIELEPSVAQTLQTDQRPSSTRRSDGAFKARNRRPRSRPKIARIGPIVADRFSNLQTHRGPAAVMVAEGCSARGCPL